MIEFGCGENFTVTHWFVRKTAHSLTHSHSHSVRYDNRFNSIESIHLDLIWLNQTFQFDKCAGFSRCGIFYDALIRFKFPFDRCISTNSTIAHEKGNPWMNVSICLEFQILPDVMVIRSSEHIWFIASTVGIPIGPMSVPFVFISFAHLISLSQVLLCWVCHNDTVIIAFSFRSIDQTYVSSKLSSQNNFIFAQIVLSVPCAEGQKESNGCHNPK